MVSVVILGGLLHGNMPFQSRNGVDGLGEIAPHLKLSPMLIGTCSEVNRPIEEENQFARHGVVSVLVARYTDRLTGQEVEGMIVGGCPGPIPINASVFKLDMNRHRPKDVNNDEGCSTFIRDGHPSLTASIYSEPSSDGVSSPRLCLSPGRGAYEF